MILNLCFGHFSVWSRLVLHCHRDRSTQVHERRAAFFHSRQRSIYIAATVVETDCIAGSGRTQWLADWQQLYEHHQCKENIHFIVWVFDILYPSTREVYNSRLFFYFISFGSVGHLHCARILCRMRQIDGRRLFYHFDCVPRCARCVYQSIGFVSQLCRYFDGHWHHHRRYDRHFGTVCRWCSHTACKCYRCDIMLGCLFNIDVLWL